ncbi:alcohol dehydrogenase catalytic domain-containing protein [Novosphingobium resinovorum]|uniref:alcohol dehydrogenase catalytic domain-containing protein n=1 Tax=Novosphingobium resinovorum TaxID=158500 RepID=UPI002ED3BBE7
MKMRAAVFEGAGLPLAIREVDVPRPGRGQLLVRVKRCGVCGSDLHLTEAHASWQVPHGTVLGHEFAGEVVEMGEGTRHDWREGDRIAALPYIGCGRCLECLAGYPFHCPETLSLATGDVVGAFSEYAVIGAREAARLSNNLSWEQGAFTETGGCRCSRRRSRPYRTGRARADRRRRPDRPERRRLRPTGGCRGGRGLRANRSPRRPCHRHGRDGILYE